MFIALTSIQEVCIVNTDNITLIVKFHECNFSSEEQEGWTLGQAKKFKSIIYLEGKRAGMLMVRETLGDIAHMISSNATLKSSLRSADAFLDHTLEKEKQRKK